MSIMDADKEILTLGTVNGWAFKIAIWFAPIFAIWMTTKVLAHDTDIAVLKMQLAMQSGGKNVSQSVNVGHTDADKPAVDALVRNWQTTQELAAKLGVTDRQVLNYIKEERFNPKPVEFSDGWHFTKGVQLLPKISEVRRILPSSSEETEADAEDCPP